MRRVSGIVASHGIAIGPLLVYRPPVLEFRRVTVTESEVHTERERYSQTVGRVRADLESIIETAGSDSEKAEIFEIQLEFLEDPTF